jgi:hypothetical protein
VLANYATPRSRFNLAAHFTHRLHSFYSFAKLWQHFGGILKASVRYHTEGNMFKKLSVRLLLVGVLALSLLTVVGSASAKWENPVRRCLEFANGDRQKFKNCLREYRDRYENIVDRAEDLVDRHEDWVDRLEDLADKREDFFDKLEDQLDQNPGDKEDFFDKLEDHKDKHEDKHDNQEDRRDRREDRRDRREDRRDRRR